MTDLEITSTFTVSRPRPEAWIIVDPNPAACTRFAIHKYPNWCRRFWYWTLLGWRIEHISTRRSRLRGQNLTKESQDDD